MINIYKKGGEEVLKLTKWGRGGDRGLHEPITKKQINWAISQSTL